MTPAIAPSSILSRNPDILEADHGDQKVLFHPADGLYCDLDAVGSRIWELLSTPQSFAELVATLTARYAVDPVTCRDQSLTCLGTLAEKGFVTTN